MVSTKQYCALSRRYHVKHKSSMNLSCRRRKEISGDSDASSSECDDLENARPSLSNGRNVESGQDSSAPSATYRLQIINYKLNLELIKSIYTYVHYTSTFIVTLHILVRVHTYSNVQYMYGYTVQHRTISPE